MNRQNRKATWYDSIKLDPGSSRAKPQPPYSPEELEKRSEFIWKNIRYVKIPRLPGRIRILPREDGETIFRSVEYIYGRTYTDAPGQSKKTSRNQKVIIGQEVEEIQEGWMLPTENYDRFFDRDGNLIPRETEEETEEKTTEDPVDGTDKQDEIKEAAETEGTDTITAENTAFPENGEPYYHHAPRSKKQAEKLLTEILEKAAKETLAKNRERLKTMPEEDMTEEERLEYDEIQAREELRRRDNRRHALHDLFSPYYHSIEVQATKHPDTIVSSYKVRKLNQILSAVMDLYRDTEYIQYLELIEEPEKDEQGKPIAGMTYSDINILMNAYEAALSDYYIFR